jgi:hypothetical protein
MTNLTHSHITWQLGNKPATRTSQFTHLGLNCLEGKTVPDVDARITSTKRATYAALGIGLHGNGLDPAM